MTSPPYVPDIEKWRKHFVAMARGQVHPDHNGHYHVGHIQSDGGKKSDEPHIQMVTPVAAAIERAKSQLHQEQDVCVRNSMRPYRRRCVFPLRNRNIDIVLRHFMIILNLKRYAHTENKNMSN
jgi:hypothetical protein